LRDASPHSVRRRYRAKESTNGAPDRINRASRAAPIAIQLNGRSRTARVSGHGK